MRLSLKITLSVLIVLHLLTAFDEKQAYCQPQQQTQTVTASPIGTTDFTQYWSAFNLLQEGANPYDGDLMHKKQLTVGQRPEATVLMWNPPWTPLLLAPILIFPFSLSANVWTIINILFLVGAIIITSNLTGSKRIFYLGLAAVSFLPALETIQLGQLSLLLAVAMMFGSYLVVRKRDLGAGAAFSILTIKPHLFFLLIVPVLIWLKSSGRYRIVVGFILTFLAMLIATALLWPSAIQWWLHALTVEPSGPGAVSMVNWRTATLTTQLRSLISFFTGNIPTWPIWFVPTVSFLAVASYFFRLGSIKWQRQAAPLICLSLGLGSYGWFFDQAVLLPFYLLLVGYALCSHEASATKRSLFFSLLAIQLFALLLGFFPNVEQATYFWLPFAFCAVWLKYERLFCSR